MELSKHDKDIYEEEFIDKELEPLHLVKARKNHHCTLCGLLIPKGHKYWVQYNEDKEIHRKEHTNCSIYENLHVHLITR